MGEKIILAERANKIVYREGDVIVKQHVAAHPQSAVLKEAFNHALAKEAGLPVPELLEVKHNGKGWCLFIRAIDGKTMAQAMEEEPEKIRDYMEQFVDIQREIHAVSSKQMGRLKDKLNAQISSLRGELDTATRYELHVRLERMKPHTKMTHGDFNPTNIILTPDGGHYVLDWAHAAVGNASADASTTYLQFALEEKQKADLYLETFCRKSGIALPYVQRWLPIVAAAQMTKKHGAEREFLTSLTQVVEFE